MWLLDTRTLELKYFVDERQVKYAILSHTWGEEEVTFQELRSPHPKFRRGYQKIQESCRRALQDGYDYAWVDTCCINKESSAELSEAINWMFRCYAQSCVCYVHLEDIRLSHEWDVAARSTPQIVQALQDSRWFTRGWTLQELIAPARHIIFDREWSVIGPSVKPLAQITGIDKDILSYRGDSDLSAVSIAAKMAWAACRQTTRLEDQAYSLLGLFDINMPLLYGEGQKAFRRLQEKIIRHTDDQSILAWERFGRLSRDDALFAPSPAAFSGFSSVVRWASGPVTSSRLSNLALEIDLPILLLEVEGKGSRFCAILNCHLKDNLTGPLALCLSPRSPGNNSNEWNMSNELHSVVDAVECSADDDQTHMLVAEEEGIRKRVMVVPRHKMNQTKWRRVHLHLRYTNQHASYRDDTRSLLDPLHPQKLIGKAPNIWVQAPRSSDYTFVATHSTPPNLWSESGLFRCGAENVTLGRRIWRVSGLEPALPSSYLYVGLMVGHSHSTDVYTGFLSHLQIARVLNGMRDSTQSSQSPESIESLEGFASYSTMPVGRSTDTVTISKTLTAEGHILKANLTMNLIVMDHPCTRSRSGSMVRLTGFRRIHSTETI